MILEPGLLAGPLPLGHGGITHGCTNLNSCLSFTSVDGKVENALRAKAFGRPSSLGPRQNTHGFTKLNSFLFVLPALIDFIPKNTSPRKTKVEDALRARAFGRPFSLGPRRNNPWLHKAQLMSFFYQR
jgi:hypothetical protein